MDRALFNQFIQRCIVILLSAWVAGCSNSLDLEEDPEPEQAIATPTPNPQLEVFNEFFLGVYGCQNAPALSILNYDPNTALDASQCNGTEETAGSNPSQLFSLDQGLSVYLDTEVDTLFRNEQLVYANQGGVFVVDIAENTSRRLTSFAGEICRLLPSTRFEPVFDSATNTESWYELNDKRVYVELVFSNADERNICSDPTRFRNYVEVGLNFDENADDFEVCASEADGRSNALDCKTRLLPVVSAARALSQPVTAYVDDSSTADPNDKTLVYGHLGWGADDRTLRFWNADGSERWSRPRELERFSAVEGIEGVYDYLFELSPLDNTHFLLQMGRDVFVFEGADLFELDDSDVSTTSTQVLQDRVYLIEQDASDSVAALQSAYDDDDLVIFDNGKFFFTDYKANFADPTPFLDRNYEFIEPLDRVVAQFDDHFEFSQFLTNECQYDADPVGCDEANDIGGTSWQLTQQCDIAVNCTFPVDVTDYCVTETERLPSTPVSALCTSERFEDLNELDDPANNLSFASFLPYYADHMRNVDFQMYDNKLLVNARLSERGALVLYDFKQPVTAPATVRESLLLGERLIQSISRPLVQNNGLFITTRVRGLRSTDICYKGFIEVTCNLAKLEEGNSDECTSFDIAAGTCREGKYNFDSRALYCPNAGVTISSPTCVDDNQINPRTLQAEAISEDGQWLPVVALDSVSGIRNEMRLLVSVDQQASTLNPDAAFVKDEGVLGNPSLYRVVSGAKDTELGQLNGVIESLPTALVLREEVGQLAANEEEFLNGSTIRQQRNYYIDETIQQFTRVAGSEQNQ